MIATPADRALAEQFAGAQPFDLPQVDLGVWTALHWNCNAPTTVATIVNGETHVIAECTGNGQHSDDAIVRAAQIAELPNIVRALQGLMALYNSDEGCRSTPEYIAAKKALAKVGVAA